MALKKVIKKTNGVTLAYHRIAMVKVDVNQQITVLVESYVDEDGRNFEKRYAAGEIEGKPTFPYTQGEYITFDYDENPEIFNGNIVQNVYDWLKKQPEFVGAENV